MNRVQRIAATLAVIVSVMSGGLTAHVSATDKKLPILMYHNVTTESSEINSMTVTDDRFRQDMEFLKEYGFTPLVAADLVNIHAGAQPMPQRPIMITFDDGYESNYTLAYPILKNTGMKCTISLITSHIRDEFGSGFPGSLTWKQIQEMHKSGIVDFGSHSHAMHNEDVQGMMKAHGENGIQRNSNESYSAYQSRMMLDTTTSVNRIKSYLGQDVPVLYFSYPFGATDRWFGQVLLDNKFYVSTTTMPRTANITRSLYGLPRHGVTMDKSVSQLLQFRAVAVPCVTDIVINNNANRLPTYKIDGSNYIRLTDLAYLLRDTQTKFALDFSGSEMSVLKGQDYQPIGGELSTLEAGEKNCISSTERIHVDGIASFVATFGVGGQYYYNLRSLADKIGFTVAYDEQNQIIVITA